MAIPWFSTSFFKGGFHPLAGNTSLPSSHNTSFHPHHWGQGWGWGQPLVHHTRGSFSFLSQSPPNSHISFIFSTPFLSFSRFKPCVVGPRVFLHPYQGFPISFGWLCRGFHRVGFFPLSNFLLGHLFPLGPPQGASHFQNLFPFFLGRTQNFLSTNRGAPFFSQPLSLSFLLGLGGSLSFSGGPLWGVSSFLFKRPL